MRLLFLVGLLATFVAGAFCACDEAHFAAQRTTQLGCLANGGNDWKSKCSDACISATLELIACAQATGAFSVHTCQQYVADNNADCASRAPGSVGASHAGYCGLR